MKIEGNQLTFPKTLEVKYSGKLVEETETEMTLEGENEDSYLKIYSPFRGIAKLLLFENGQWIDAESGAANFDFSSLGLENLPNFENLESEISTGEAETEEIEDGVLVEEQERATPNETPSETENNTQSGEQHDNNK